jgi:hypothetical protein
MYEEENALKKSRNYVRNEIQNSTPVDEDSIILFILDPDHLIPFQVCKYDMWEISAKRSDTRKTFTESKTEAKNDKKEDINPKGYSNLFKKIAVVAVISYHIYKSYHNGGIVHNVVQCVKENLLHIFIENNPNI